MKDGEKVLKSFKIFAQVNSRLMEFLMGWLLVRVANVVADYDDLLTQ